MIKSNELRVGNYLLFDGLPNRVASIHSDDTMRFYTGQSEKTHGCYGMEDERINPVPLTPDILEKAGAKNDGREFILNVGALKMKFRYNTEWYSELGEIYLGSHVQYLHQLQNLRFAITGNELEINL
jgi:hypothetical protein